MPDAKSRRATPRVALLDFGCSKTLSPRQRAALARLYLALSRRDEHGIYTAAVEMGVRTRHMDTKVIVRSPPHPRQTLYKPRHRLLPPNPPCPRLDAASSRASAMAPGQVDFAMHFFDRDMTTSMSPPVYLLHLSRQRDQITGLPADYMLVARSSLLLRGLGGKLRAPQQCGRSWGGAAKAYLRSVGEPERLSEEAAIAAAPPPRRLWLRGRRGTTFEV